MNIFYPIYSTSVQWPPLQRAQQNTFGISVSLSTLWNASGSSDWCLQCKAFDLVSLGWKSLSINTQYAESSVAFKRTNQASAAKNCPVDAKNGLAKVDTTLKGFYPKLPLFFLLSHPQTGGAEPKDPPTDSVMVPSLFKAATENFCSKTEI